MGYKLTYFDVRGLGEHIRYLLYDQGIAFEDDAFAREAWPAIKAKMQFGQAPCLFDGEEQIVQSNAIMRHLGRVHKLYGSNESEATFLDMVAEAVQDVRNRYVYMIYMNYADKPKLMAEFFPAQLEMIERCIKSRGAAGGDYILGGSVSFVDYVLFEMLDVLSLSQANILQDRPRLAAFHKAMAVRPNLAKFLATEAHQKRKINGNDNV